MIRKQFKQSKIIRLFLGMILVLWNHFYVGAQKGKSITFFGIPQRTYMQGPQHESFIARGQNDFSEETKIHKLPSYNFALGFLYKKEFSSRLEIGWGFQFASVDQKYKTRIPLSEIRGNVESSIRLKYIKTPLLIQYNYIVREKKKMFLAIGPQLNILIAENGEIPVYNLDGNGPIFDGVDPGGAYRNFVLGGFLTTGIQMDLDDKVGIFFAPYIDATFSAVEKQTFIHLDDYINNIFDAPNATIRTKHIIAVGVMMGFVFKVKNKKSLE